MSRDDMHLFEISVDFTGESNGDVIVAWKWMTGGFQQRITASELLFLVERSKDIHDKFRSHEVPKESAIAELLNLGRILGDLVVSIDNVPYLLDALDIRHMRFALCRVSDHALSTTALPWETLRLPGTDIPLLFHPRVRGSFDYARSYDLDREAAGRRVTQKCLAAWAVSPRRDLMVETEVEELRSRLLLHPSIRFRWVINPDVKELRARLELECALFLYAGHGDLIDDSYKIELDSTDVDVRLLLASLKASRAEVLVFDSCDSGYGSSSVGLPSFLRQLPNTTCLLGMWGPANDLESCWNMPSTIERLLIGQPIWSCVNLLRLLLYDQGSSAWFQPTIFLKRNYRPFDVLPNRKAYLDGLSLLLEERRHRSGRAMLRRQPPRQQ